MILTEIKVINNLTRDKSGLHPTQKPIELFEYFIKTYTNEMDVVLDFTMGSGPCGAAAINLSRKFIGFEINENYFKIAEERIMEALKEKRKENCGKQNTLFWDF